MMSETHDRPAATRQLTTGPMPAQATLQDDHTEAEDALGPEVAGCVEPAGRPVTDAAAGGGVHATVGPVRRLMAAVVIVALAVVVVTALGSGPARAAGTSSS